MAVTVDTRGLSCPQPVMLTLNAIKNAEDTPILVLVDTDTSRENVVRAAQSKGYVVEKIEHEGDEYRITLHKGERS